MSDKIRASLTDALSALWADRNPVPNRHWKVLFDYYNSKNVKKLGMGCKPCFKKVFDFCLNELK